MINFAIDGSWNQIKGKLQQRFGQLTDDDVSFVEGKSDELLGRLQSKLAMTETDLESLLFELKEKVSSEAGPAGMDSLKANATHLSHEIRGRAAAAVDELKSAAAIKAEELKAQASRAYGSARQKTRTLQTEAEEYVRGNPRDAVLGAVIAGFIIGLMIRR